ncbi:MAG TPA: hypothetical protein H9735_03305 [Candidatus Anaerostipes excrementavium]|uniref:Uncharacterized protein n=1 Tax=Candidatus Anaerostipes excrementavium TaxID=2838463 RepID=A0A9D2B8S8_9FIRM|nr:hypothetical protein [uncultured Anaerostipes sp.]HIX67138.1 hypothetical protein [Candidatus Anaerostipes excrementavium]
MNQNWKNNPRLQAIDPKKLEIMEFLVAQCQGKSLEMILPDLMAASSRLSEQGLSFTNAETAIIIDALKEDMSPEEQQRIDALRGFIL